MLHYQGIYGWSVRCHTYAETGRGGLSGMYCWLGLANNQPYSDSLKQAFMPPLFMLKRLVLSSLTVLGTLGVVLGLAFWFRDPLLKFGAGYVLADSQISITALDGLQFNARQVSLENLELVLPSGQRLLLAGVQVRYVITSVQQMPEILALMIRSADLQNPDDMREVNSEADQVSPLLLSELFQSLRELPLPTVEITQLRVPQWPDSLSFSLQQHTGALDLDIHSGALQLLASFSQADAAAAAQVQVTLMRSEVLVGNAQLVLEPEADIYSLLGTGHLAFADFTSLLADLQQAAGKVPLNSANVDWTLAGSVADDLRGTFKVTTPATFVLGLQAGSSLVLPAGLSSGLGELELAFNDQLELTIITGAGWGIGAGRIPLHLVSSWQQQPVLIDTVLTLGQCQFAPTMPCLVDFKGLASIGAYSLQGELAAQLPGLGAGLGQYRLQSSDLVLGGLPAQAPDFDIAASVVLDQDSLSFTTPLLLRDVPQDPGITVAGTYSLVDGIATAHVSMPALGFTPDTSPLSAWLKRWPYPFDVLDGSLTAQGDLRFQPGPSGGIISATVSGALTEIGGFYGDIYFRGLNGALQGRVELADALNFSTPALELRVAGIDAGVPMENLLLKYQFDSATGQLLIPEFYGEALGGTVTATDVDYNFTRERNEVTVHFDSLHLEQMLALAQYDGVQAVGAVSGILPLTLTRVGVEMVGGTLQADAPGGSIAYLNGAAAGLAGNAGLDMVNKVLGNYQFSSIISSIDYSPSGELALAMQMQGYNPDMGSDQPINLNLNLSDNIPALLRSLRAARAIEDFLEQQNQ